MDAAEFRKRGREMVDFIAEYMTDIQSLKVIPEVEPGYLRKLLPEQPPKKSDDWHDIMEDVNNAILPGITHWQHPHFHAYFPSGNSYPSILGDMLSNAFGCIGFSWAASPACTELETLMLDWVGKMIKLPTHFLHESGIGGGVIQGSASDSVLVGMLSARHKVMKAMKEKQPYIEEGHLLSKLVGYCSKLAHSCVEKAGMIGYVKIRQLDVDDHYALRGWVLEDAIEEDRKLGLIPFFVCATLGTTACCSFDNISEIGQVTSTNGLYLHVDAAYAGNALICPEFQHLSSGLEYVDSFGFNTNKWLQVNFDCSLMWVRKVEDLTTALTVDPLYLQHKHGNKAIDLRHWGIPLSRRFRALKLWFVIRSYGVEGLQDIIRKVEQSNAPLLIMDRYLDKLSVYMHRYQKRKHVRLAKLFQSQVMADDRFEILGDVILGLVCFRLKGPNSLTQKLLKHINDSGKIHMVPSMINEHYVIRFALCTEHACLDDVLFAWDAIFVAATDLLQARQIKDSNKGEQLSDELDSDVDETLSVFEEEIIYDNQREHVQRAQATRNFFFKMISDPKHYGPRVMRSQQRQTKSVSERTMSEGCQHHLQEKDVARKIVDGGEEEEEEEDEAKKKKSEVNGLDASLIKLVNGIKFSEGKRITEREGRDENEKEENSEDAVERKRFAAKSFSW